MNSILPKNHQIEKEFQTKIDTFFKQCHLSKLLKQSNFQKQAGFSCLHIFRFIFMLVFTGKNLFRMLQSGTVPGEPAKDTVYRFLNSARHNWRKFLLLFSTKVINDYIAPLTSKDRVNVLILDDSLYSRNRSKKVELLARVYDHVSHKYHRGFRMLTLGWSDGNTFLPLAFSLLSSEKEQNRICGIDARVDKRTNGYKRRAEGIKKTTDVMFDLLGQVNAYKFPASYLLFDSWFAFPKVIRRVLEHKLHVICMVKATPKVFYQYQGKQMDLKTLYASLSKKRGRAKVLASVVIGIGNDSNGVPVKAKIVFVRDRNRSRNWLALLSTDISLSDEEIVRIYGKRWDIEVFFKMCKSYLNLSKEFQGRSYDCMVAHTTIVFIRYIMLALERRNCNDLRTLGELFYLCCDELRDIKFVEAFGLLMELLKNYLEKYLHLPGITVHELLDHFVAGLPAFLKVRLQLSVCES